MATGRVRLQRQTLSNHSGDAARRHQYTSNNRAKLPFEFSSRIERASLKVRYGDGFSGAPLRVSGATRRVTTGAETSSDEQIQESSSTPVRGDHDV
jgi:hypothetical protein